MDEYTLKFHETVNFPKLMYSGKSFNYIKSMNIHSSQDCLEFLNENNFGSYWGLNEVSCFKELRNYRRLMEMPLNQIDALASRMSRLLFDNDSKKGKILEELLTLQNMQKSLVDFKKIVLN